MSTSTIRTTWRTTDYFLASFLVGNGMRILGVGGASPRKFFVLDDPDPSLREQLTLRYRLGEDDQVSAHALFEAQKHLQRLLRDSLI